MPEQALDGTPLGLGLIVKINLLFFHAERVKRLSRSFHLESMSSSGKPVRWRRVSKRRRRP